MSIQEEQNYHGKIVSQQQEITERDIISYLQNNIDFFKNNPNILSQMEIPHECSGAASLIEVQVSVLRDKNDGLKAKMLELMQVARENDQLAERMLRLTLSLMGAVSLEQTLQVLDTSIRSEFQADAIAIRLFEQDNMLAIATENIISKNDPEIKPFENFFRAERPLCGRLKREQLEFMFRDMSGEIQSAVLIPLGHRSGLGMLAIGSKDKDRFHPGMGTVFLKQMGVLVTGMLKHYIKDPLISAL